MSWEMTTVVVPYSVVRSLIRLSITMAVCGSRPELGSSQKRYCGRPTMARARATRFCMPPDTSAGNRSSAPSNSTRFRHSMARSRRSSAVMSLNIRKGNSTFSSTVMLSNRAPPWKSMPMRRRTASRSFRSRSENTTSSYCTRPASTSSRPTMHLVSTDLPEPLRPMMKFTWPAWNSASMPWSTVLSPKDFSTPRTRIMSAGVG